MAPLRIFASLSVLGVAASAIDINALLTDFSFPDCANGPLRNNLVCDSDASPLDRAAALVNEMTTEEKLNNTGNSSPGVPRLGLPEYQYWNEALHGLFMSFPLGPFNNSANYSSATQFPQPILMAAAFDDDIVRDAFAVVANETRAYSNALRTGLTIFAPNINLFRDPRWGRGQETPGEDPYHASRYVQAVVEGMQGGHDAKFKKTIATCKHFAGYDVESWSGNARYQYDAKISMQDLSEYYMPPFEACAKDAGSFMCSYNAVNGVPTCADPYLLQTILREHWGWGEGLVVADCGAIQNIWLPHQWSPTREQAVADALKAGSDLDCGTYYPQNLPSAFENGLFNESTLDQALVRQFSALISTGYFDSAEGQPFRQLGPADINTPYAQELALRSAVEGIVLLKNDGTLPLLLRNVSIALIGDWANASVQMQGSYYGQPPYLHTPVYAAEQHGNGVTVNYSPGVTRTWNPATDLWPQAWEAADKSDIIIYLGGIDNSNEAENLDRTSLSWTGAQMDVISQLASSGKPTIVVQMGGGQMDSSPLLKNENISALLWAGYPGQSGGTAIFDIITGKSSPAGRLPQTMYPSRFVYEMKMTDMSMRPSETSPGRTYKWYNGSVLDYGFGLHYTTFNASIKSEVESTYNLSSIVSQCSSNSTSEINHCTVLTLDTEIANTGNRSSDYVTLLFLSGSFGPAPHPRKSLVSYTRLFNIQPGASATASLPITLSSLLRSAENGDKVLHPGNYSLCVDVDCRDSVAFMLAGEPVTIEEWPQPPPIDRVKGVPGFEGYYVSELGPVV